MRINLGSYPTQPKTYTVDMPRLAGGLNLQELDYRLDPDESPEMRNLWWQDDVLQCRDGQVYLSEDEKGTGFTCSKIPYFGETFFHIGSRLYYGHRAASAMNLTEIVSGVPENRGTFFRYQDSLFYKNKGGFYQITYDGSSFSAESLLGKAYTPVIVINAAPATGAGSMYQPENRLSARKTVWYNADGSTVYQLPVTGISAVTEVEVDGETLIGGYEVDKVKGTVTFSSAPPTTEPATNNTVRITYEKDNPEAMSAIMDCEYAVVAGGNTDLCIILGGCDAQPNAIFWNSNDNLAMNPAYWPISYYNLVGDTADPVTGFGKQYSTLVVLKEQSLGKLLFTVEEVDGRNSISFTYEDVNTHVGCDLPWTIQLVENNLVFANSYRGIHVLKSSSSAFENNVDCISLKVNGTGAGLLNDLRRAGVVTSFDDDTRYWVCADGVCYVWDYTISGAADPSWFYFTGVPAVCFFHDDSHNLHHLDVQGRVTAFERVFSDYGSAIEKAYRFPTQLLGGYDRLKDILYVLLSIRSDTDSDISIRYDTDYETRYDMTPVRTYSYRVTPRNLTRRCLSSARYAFVAKRKPGCRHIRHFSMTLSNNKAGEDLAIVSMQIYYRYQGKER